MSATISKDKHMRILPIVATAFLLAGCGGRGHEGPRGVDRDEVLLSVVASGEAENRPDVATFSAGVSTIAPTSEAATRINNEKMNKVMAAVEGLGVKRDDTKTQSLTVGRIDWGRNKGQFEASNQVSVKIHKIDDATNIIGAATKAGANILSGPDLAVDDKEAASKGAYAAAYKAARARADAYAAAAGLKVKRILSITDGSAMGGSPQPYAMDAAAETAAPPQTSGPPIRAGLDTSSAQVKVEFVLSE
jgi:uncharacterized protein